MKSNKSNSSSFRYLLARLKPFGNFMFWGPLTFLGFCFSLIGYISTHPELLANIREQPQTIEDNIAEQEASNNPALLEPPAVAEGETEQNWEQLYQPPIVSDQAEATTEEANPNQNAGETNVTNSDGSNSVARKSSNSIFQPLLPEIKSSPNANNSRIEPVKPASVLPQNHLQQALESNSRLNNYNSNNSANIPRTNSEINRNNQNQSGNTGYNYDYSNQPSLNNYQVPYNNYPTQSQPVTGGYQNPYSYNNNYPNQASNSTSQPNYNNGAVTPGTQTQIQPSIDESNNYY